MAVRDVLKVSRKTFFDPKAWIGTDLIKSYNSIIMDSVRDLFISRKPARQESFEHAKKRLGLSDAELKNIANNYRLYAYFFVLCGALVLLFSFYLLFHHSSFSGWLLGFAASALFGAYAFRFHFWYFQIKRRKLGCTYEEWKQFLLNNKDAT